MSVRHTHYKKPTSGSFSRRFAPKLLSPFLPLLEICVYPLQDYPSWDALVTDDYRIMDDIILRYLYFLSFINEFDSERALKLLHFILQA